MTSNNFSETNNLFVELTKTDMAATTGGTVSATFLNRWAARVRNGNPKITSISRRLVNEFYRGGLTSTSASSWSATASDADKSAWKSVAPTVMGYLNPGQSLSSPSPIPAPALFGVTPAAISGVQAYLNLF